MFGKLFEKHKEVAEIGCFLNLENGNCDSVPGFKKMATDEEVGFVNMGSRENIIRHFELSSDQVAALDEYGYIEIDSGVGIGTVYLEAGYGF